MKEVVLFSGGPDSLIAWEYLHRPDALHIKHGCAYDDKQLQAVYKIRAKTMELDKIKIDYDSLYLKKFEKHDAFIPLRNMYFVMVAANHDYELIWLTVQRGEQNIPDRSPEFLQRISKELSIQMEHEVTVDCVFSTWTKQDMVKWYVDEGYDINLLKQTVSCFHPIYERCGACPACFRRWIAF